MTSFISVFNMQNIALCVRA